ncbi:MAG: hypothetical protein IKO55_00285 [Kiritimatiellae bacterium]|nr:hypothetical protein [Kiritimatiellia bacterium]
MLGARYKEAKHEDKVDDDRCAGKKSRFEVAVVAMKRAGEAKNEAEKLLLMKGAFAEPETAALVVGAAVFC